MCCVELAAQLRERMRAPKAHDQLATGEPQFVLRNRARRTLVLGVILVVVVWCPIGLWLDWNATAGIDWGIFTVKAAVYYALYVGISVSITLASLHRQRVRARRVCTTTAGRACPRCTYCLTGLGSAGTCPECGVRFELRSVVTFWYDRAGWRTPKSSSYLASESAQIDANAPSPARK